MGIQIDITLYGSQIAGGMANEPEEFAYFLNEMAATDAATLGAEVWGHAPYDRTDEIVAWLRALADAIEAGEA